MKRIDRKVWAALLIMGMAGCAPGSDDGSTPTGEVAPPTVEASDDLDVDSAQALVIGGRTSCLSSSPASTGFCGSYFCKTSTTRFAWGFNTAGKCGNARSFMCAGTMPSTAQRCMRYDQEMWIGVN